VPDEQHLKTMVQMKELVLYHGFLMYPYTNLKLIKESWGDNEDEDDENDSDDISDEGVDENDEGDDMNDDDEETDSDRTESNRIKIPILNQSTTKYYKEEEKIDDKETMDDDEDDEVTKELYEDVNVNLGNEDTKMTNDDQGASEQQNVSQESGFEQVEEDAHLLNLENPSPSDNEIASLMETSTHHVMAVPEITFDFSFVFRFNDRVTNLEKDLSEIKQVDQYAQALSSIPAIVNRYMDNKLGEAINKAIQAYNLDCRQEAQDEKNAYIELVNTSMRNLIKEESAHAKEPSHTVEDSGMQQDQEFVMGNNDEQPADKEVTKADWFKKPKRPPTPDLIGTRDNKWTSDLLRPGLVKLLVLKNLDVYSRKRIIVVTRLSIMEKYDYGHLEEIKVCQEDQKLYKFREGDFS
ncbi:hypothetical protein Tco_1099569, partial [Tanacetum coccineum]